VGEVDLHGWFSADELSTCSACGEPSGVRLPASGSLLCLACGSVTLATELPESARDDTGETSR
jgi:hypothetical protein